MNNGFEIRNSAPRRYFVKNKFVTTNYESLKTFIEIKVIKEKPPIIEYEIAKLVVVSINSVPKPV